jgi:hypothetical protein
MKVQTHIKAGSFEIGRIVGAVAKATLPTAIN